jgi:hypothetical protein
MKNKRFLTFFLSFLSLSFLFITNYFLYISTSVIDQAIPAMASINTLYPSESSPPSM